MKLGVTATKRELCSFVLQFCSNPLCLNDIEHSSTDLDTLVFYLLYIFCVLKFVVRQDDIVLRIKSIASLPLLQSYSFVYCRRNILSIIVVTC